MSLPSRSLKVVLYFTYTLFTCGLVQSSQGPQTASSDNSPTDCTGAPCISTSPSSSASGSSSINGHTRSLMDTGSQTSQVVSITTSTVTDVVPSFSFSTASPFTITSITAPSNSNTGDSTTLTDSSTSISQVPDPSQSITNTADSGGGQTQGTHTKSPRSSTSTTIKNLPTSVAFVNPMIVVTLPTVISGKSTIVVSTATESPNPSSTLPYVLPPAVFKSSGIRSRGGGFGIGSEPWRGGEKLAAFIVVVVMVFLWA